MSFFDKLVEKRIREAEAQGAFEDLPGQGQPLQLEDDAHIPEELRLAYKILKNAGCLPPELQLKKEIRQLQDLMEGIEDEKEKLLQMKKLNYLVTKLNMLGRGSPLLEEHDIYYAKVVERVRPAKKGPER